MIVSELQILEEIREPLRGDSLVFHDAFLAVTPEALHPFEVHSATREVFPVVYAKVPVAAEHERVVDPVAVRVDNASPTNLLDIENQHTSSCPGVGKHFHEDSSLPLKKAENREFAGDTPSLFPFSPPSKNDLSTFTSPLRNPSPSGE